MKIQIKSSCVRDALMILFFTLASAVLFSQEYKYEIGSTVGASFYIGDANRTKLLLHPGAAGGALFRYNLNSQWAWKARITGGSVSGNTTDSGNRFPADPRESFQRTLVDIGSDMEFHFFRYGNKYGYLGTKPYTPYLLLGVGITYAAGENSFLGVNVPMGLGFKYSFRNRMNIGTEVSIRMLFRDDLDVTKKTSGWSLDAPFRIESSPLKNQDGYSFALIYLTWDFGIKEKPCR